MKDINLTYRVLQLLTQKHVSNQRLLAAKLRVSLGRINAVVQDIRAQGLIQETKNVPGQHDGSTFNVLTQKGIVRRRELVKQCLTEKTKRLNQLEKEIIQLNLDLEEINNDS